MEFSVESLQQHGGFSGPPVKRSVEWQVNGETLSADVYIRPMSYSTVVDNPGGKSTGEIVAQRLARSVCHKDGSPVFRVSDVTGYNEDGTPVITKVNGEKVERGPLNRELTEALVALVMEVSGLGKKKPRSQETTSSGMS